MYLLVILIALWVIYLAFIREEAPSAAAPAQEAKAETAAEAPPTPSEPQGEVDPFKAPGT